MRKGRIARFALLSTALAVSTAASLSSGSLQLVGISATDVAQLLRDRSPGGRGQAALSKTKLFRQARVLSLQRIAALPAEATPGGPEGLIGDDVAPIVSDAGPAMIGALPGEPDGFAESFLPGVGEGPLGPVFEDGGFGWFGGGGGGTGSLPGGGGGGGASPPPPGGGGTLAPPPGPTPAVPEPATWAVMLIGFGAVGAALRRRRRAGVDLSPKLAAGARHGRD